MEKSKELSIIKILNDHALYLKNKRKYAEFRAVFKGMDLNGIKFLGKDLRFADFRGCDISGALFIDCNLKDAIFTGCKLYEATFRCCHFTGIWKSGRYIPLCAIVNGYGYTNPHENGMVYNHHQIFLFPDREKKALIGYKVINNSINDKAIAKLIIPKDAERIIFNKEKCRSSYAYVEDIYNLRGEHFDRGYSCITFFDPITYIVGEYVYADSFDPDPSNFCTHGIHFYLSEEEISYLL